MSIRVGQLLAICILGLFSTIVRGQDAQHEATARQFLGQHVNSYANQTWEYGGKVAEVAWDSLPSKPSATTLPVLQDVVVDKVNVVQPIVRQLPPQGATAVQVADFHKQKDDKIDAALSPLAGQVVAAEFKVDDVLDASKFESGRGGRSGIMPGPSAGRYFVIGYFAPHVPPGRATAGRGQPVNPSQAAGSAFPNLIYVFTDDPGVSKWGRDETHSVIGVVQKVGMWIGTQAGSQPQAVGGLDPRVQPSVTVQLLFVVKSFASSAPVAAAPAKVAVPSDIVSRAQSALDAATVGLQAAQADAQVRLQKDPTYKQLLAAASDAAARKKSLQSSDTVLPQDRLDAAAALTKAQARADQYPEIFLTTDEAIRGATRSLAEASAQLEVAKEAEAAAAAAADAAKQANTARQADAAKQPDVARGTAAPRPADAPSPSSAAKADAPFSAPVALGTDMTVQIDSANFGHVSWKDFMDGPPSDDGNNYLVITVTVKNNSATRKYDYMTWRGNAFADGTLSDDIGNSYKQIDKGMEGPVGSAGDQSIYPGKTLTDVLVFELPVAGAKTLTLELPGGNVHVQGSAKFQIRIGGRP